MKLKWQSDTCSPRRCSSRTAVSRWPYVPAPPDDQQLAPAPSHDLLFGDEILHAGHLGRTQADHALVILRIVRHGPAQRILFQAAHPVLDALGPGQRPHPGQPFLVARIRLKTSLRSPGNDRRRDFRVFFHRRNPPRLRAVGDKAVGKQQHGVMCSMAILPAQKA